MRSAHTGVLAAAAAIMLLGACQSDPAHHSAGTDAAASRSSPVAADPPPGVEPERVTPLAGEALQRARMPLAQVVAGLPKPDYLRHATPAQPGATPPADADASVDPQPGAAPDAAATTDPALAGESPLAAQRAYVAGRLAYRQGNAFEAIEQLEQAHRLAPEQPHILRLLGEIYTATGNKVKGAYYLKQAAALDPNQPEVIYLLGRFAAEQGRRDEAIVAFHRALTLVQQSSDAPPALAPLVRYHLAGVLREAGYAAAAIEQANAHLNALDQDGRVARRSRELALLERQQGFTWMAVGDLHHQLHEPARARDAYLRADQVDGVSDEALIPRLVYTHLRLGDVRTAQDLAIEQVRQDGGDPTSLELVGYLTEQGVGGEALADRLEAVYADEGRPASLAMAIANLLPAPRGQALLRGHLQARPGDRQVFEHLLRQYLLPDGASDAAPAQLIEAIQVTADLMAAAPQHAEAYATELMQAAGDYPPLLRGFEAMTEDQRGRPQVAVLYGTALAGAGQPDKAAAVLEQAVQAQPDLAVARLQLAKLAVLRNQFDEAGQWLAPLADSKDPSVVALRVRVLAETGEPDEALALLDRMIDGRGMEAADTQLILQKAQLQLKAGDAAAAERTLLDALNTRPHDEAIYAALFELYDPSGPIADWQRQWTRLVNRLLGTIPNSRLGRLVRAELLDARGQFEQAEELLLELLVENERDVEALQRLLEVYRRSDQRAKAVELIERMLAEHPEDRTLLILAQQFYEQIGDMPRMLELAERLLKMQPLSPERARSLAVLYLTTDRPDQAVRVLEKTLGEKPAKIEDPVPLVSLLWRAMLKLDRADEAERRVQAMIDRFPEHEADLRFEHATLVDRRGDKARSEQLMLAILERFPDHAPTNNTLGYIWTVQNKNLERAKAMIQRAVDAEPDEAAYLDSLGWVYYKLGQFEEAVVWLRRSRAAEGGAYPVILDHLGDALYRLGREREAQRAWQEALGLMEHTRRMTFASEHPELEGLDERLRAKIEAVRADQEPEVARLPGEVEPVAGEGPADEPAAEVAEDAAVAGPEMPEPVVPEAMP